MGVIRDGSEVEVLALEPRKVREVTATSSHGNDFAKTLVDADGPTPLTIRLKPAG
jgi:hypothetical protein